MDGRDLRRERCGLYELKGDLDIEFAKDVELESSIRALKWSVWYMMHCKLAST